MLKYLIALFFIWIGIAMIKFTVAPIVSNLWPSAPAWLIFSVSLVLMASFSFLITRVFGGGADNPNFFRRNTFWISFGLIIGGWVGSGGSILAVTAFVTFDNGTKNDVNISYVDRAKDTVYYLVKADSSLKCMMPIGKLDLKINGIGKSIETVKESEYIYNIEKANDYVLTEIMYAEGNVNFEPTIADIVGQEFFKIDVDYIFKAPETQTEAVTKKIIYRKQDWIKEVQFIDDEKK